MLAKLNNTTAEVYFHSRDEIYEVEKPFLLRYEAGPRDIKTNINKEKHCIEIHDLRGLEDEITLSGCGITPIAMQSQLDYDDFASVDKVQHVYVSEVVKALQELFNASHVHVFDSVLRRRHLLFPVSTGDEYQFNQPTNLVHIDATKAQSQEVFHQIHKAQNIDKTYRRVQSVKYISYATLPNFFF